MKKHLFCWKRERTKLFVNKALKGEIHLPWSSKLPKISFCRELQLPKVKSFSKAKKCSNMAAQYITWTGIAFNFLSDWVEKVCMLASVEGETSWKLQYRIRLKKRERYRENLLHKLVSLSRINSKVPVRGGRICVSLGQGGYEKACLKPPLWRQLLQHSIFEGKVLKLLWKKYFYLPRSTLKFLHSTPYHHYIHETLKSTKINYPPHLSVHPTVICLPGTEIPPWPQKDAQHTHSCKSWRHSTSFVACDILKHNTYIIFRRKRKGWTIGVLLK